MCANVHCYKSTVVAIETTLFRYKYIETSDQNWKYICHVCYKMSAAMAERPIPRGEGQR